MIFDVSMNIEDGMVHWPSDPAVSINHYSNIKDGKSSNNSQICFGTHTGTHIDAPHHFVDEGPGIDGLNLETLIGPCRVIEAENGAASITASFLSGQDIKKGERILFKTKNSIWLNEGDRNFHEDYVHVASDAARYMVDSGVVLVGVDYLSVEGYHIGHDTHMALLGAGVIVIEGLNLYGIEPGYYKITALPIKIKGSDGAPSRVLLEK